MTPPTCPMSYAMAVSSYATAEILLCRVQYHPTYAASGITLPHVRLYASRCCPTECPVLPDSTTLRHAGY